MKEVIVIGSGIAGMSAAVRCAEHGISVTLVSPFSSERSQSVMAAGGINAFTDSPEPGDSLDSYIDDTLKGGCHLAGKNAVTGLCENSGKILKYLENIGAVFSIENDGSPSKRSFGGQSHKRTYYCGSSTGKHIVSALVMEVRRYEASGMIKRLLWSCFHSALIKDGKCYGAIVFNEGHFQLEAIYGDALIIATGGQNTLFGKTTGSTQCDGYTAGKLFTQGAELKNLEFIQYHPTTHETTQKKLLISEAVRGEGGRLFYYENGKKIYFMEDKYGKNGNLMTRDIVSREIYELGKDVYLDISFLDNKIISSRLSEVQELCLKYAGVDITKSPIPVTPSVHFFMGGLAVHLNHETNIKNLFAVGECASIYHGANRLGGNSLLAAIYGGWCAADEIAGRSSHEKIDFSKELEKENKILSEKRNTGSQFPVMYIRDMLAESMEKNMGIVRSEEGLKNGIHDVDYLLSIAEKINYDSSVLPYFNYSLTGILTIARASLECALFRKESRGSHCRRDFPDTYKENEYSTIISYNNGDYLVRYDKEQHYEN